VSPSLGAPSLHRRQIKEPFRSEKAPQNNASWATAVSQLDEMLSRSKYARILEFRRSPPRYASRACWSPSCSVASAGAEIAHRPPILRPIPC